MAKPDYSEAKIVLAMVQWIVLEVVLDISPEIRSGYQLGESHISATKLPDTSKCVPWIPE